MDKVYVFNTLRNAGFKVEMMTVGVLATLSNRKVSRLEIKAVLGEEFDLRSTGEGVIVKM